MATIRCVCDRVPRQVGERWVVITRRSPPLTCQVKCLACGRWWWSRSRYTARLRDHAVQSRKGMTDSDILDRILKGSLIVDTQHAIVHSVTHRGSLQLRIFERESNGTSYRFVEVSSGGKKKKIALHRLIWIAANRRVVPDGMDIDHTHGKSIPFADAINNLRLMPASENRSRGKPEYVDPRQMELQF